MCLYLYIVTFCNSRHPAIGSLFAQNKCAVLKELEAKYGTWNIKEIEIEIFN